MDKFQKIFNAIKMDPMNHKYTEKSIDPLYSAHKNATILLVGQAPGAKAEASKLFWNDASGDLLRKWLGVSRETFYKSDKFSILPMDFYFPGKGKSGDLAPRKGFAEKWHPQLLSLMPNIALTVLIGNYAIHHYLHLPNSTRLTDIVKDYQSYLPSQFPIVHPSPRNNIWQAKNPWFQKEVIPALQKRVHQLL